MHNLHLQFPLAFFAGWVNRSQQALIEYLKTEKEIYREKLGKKRIRFTDDQRRRLAIKAKAFGRKALSEMDCISPNLNFYAERFVSSIKSERLNKVILFSEPQLCRAVGPYVEHYHLERPHQGLDNERIKDRIKNTSVLDSPLPSAARSP